MPSVSPLASWNATKEVLDAHGLSTKHSLGQNFLVNDGVLAHILQLSEACDEDVVLEVGPGIGTLSLALLPHVSHLISVEADTDLPAVLTDTCAAYASDRFTLLSMDALKLTEADLVADARGAAGVEAVADVQGAAGVEASVGSRSSALVPGFAPLPQRLPNKLISNLPYAVAATLVLDYFQRFPFIQSMTVMVQKEVADRMCADIGCKDYGAYTVKLRLYADFVGRFPVSPGNFFPPPRVDSAVVRFDRRGAGDELGDLTEEDRAWACLMADAAFAARRKTISNSCKSFFSRYGGTYGRIVEDLPAIFADAGIDPRRRGETLTLADFVLLGKLAKAVID